MEQKIERLKNIKFEHADNILPNKDREAWMTSQANIWLGEYIKQINEKEIIVHVYFDKQNHQHIWFDGIDKKFIQVLMQHMEKYQDLRNRRK